jgi:two-component system sensor histidine kinase and response regulator WspE
MELFRAELDTHLPVLGEGLLALEKDGDQPKLIEAMMRAAHSIKGAGRIVGVDPAVKIAHVMEDCLVAAQKGQVRLDAGAIDVLLRGVDMLTHVGKPTVAAEYPGADFLDELVQAIAAIRTRTAPSAEPEAPENLPSVVHGPENDSVLRPDNLDRDGADRLRQQLVTRKQAGDTHFRLDLSGVRDIDAAALVLLALFTRTPCLDGSPPRLEIVKANRLVRQVLHLTRLDSACLVVSGEEG